MASTPTNDHIRYEPDEKCTPLSSFVVGIQGIVLVLPLAVSIVVINVLATGQDEAYLTWSVFSALIGVLVSALIGSVDGGSANECRVSRKSHCPCSLRFLERKKRVGNAEVNFGGA